MPNVPLLLAGVWFQTKHQFPWHVRNFDEFEVLQLLQARDCLQQWARSNEMLFNKRQGSSAHLHHLQPVQLIDLKQLEFPETAFLKLKLFSLECLLEPKILQTGQCFEVFQWIIVDGNRRFLRLKRLERLREKLEILIELLLFCLIHNKGRSTLFILL
ncbi:hypothetical protein PanWU01x14_185090 [Parasponia andersonii]|uniref:Uncharacterized protein n=1 Tax=Parasponia andersonii TaxID=3476 RepID=A0A2P5C493_PARAD|nr:hypothetical protein PanWU01x14_185090 [Parasponia andersonii]